MEKKGNLGLSDMVDLAIDYYGIDKEEAQLSRNTFRKKVERFVKSKGNTAPYLLTPESAKYIIEVELWDYFVAYSSDEELRSSKERKDNARKLLERHSRAFRDYTEGEEGQLTVYPESPQVDKQVNDFILRALLNVFFEFDEASYREDCAHLANANRALDESVCSTPYFTDQDVKTQSMILRLQERMSDPDNYLTRR